MSGFKIELSTSEGYRKDKSPESKKRHRDRAIHLTFSGNDAPIKAIHAMMQKFGVRKEEL
jgi:hypothetical protein